MPLYDYECKGCGGKAEFFVSIKYRDEARFYCEECGKDMKRIIAGAPPYHGEPYQMKAILSNGQKVAGHFGKEAKRNRQ